MFSSKEKVDTLLAEMIQAADGVSDLLFVTGKPPMVENYGKLQPYDFDQLQAVLTPELIEQLAHVLMGGLERLVQELAQMGSCDCSYSVPNFARFRVNIYRQNGAPAIVMRKLQSQLPTLERLELPPIFNNIVREKTGIVFVTGGTGSGKTTTLAAMLNEINQTQEVHVVTLEDPIEFLHPHMKAVFSQRELGRDFPDFPTGLRAALRQAPKVILIGEIRDRESMEIALTASETGHVVFSTLHTVSAGQCINRILGMFSKEEETQIRQRLADALRYVISQRLVAKTSGGRMLVTEIMGSSLRTREVIAYGESDTRNYHEIIEAGDTMGWHSFEQCLIKAYEEDLITEESAMLFCTNKMKMRKDLDVAKRRKNPEIHPSGMKLASI